MDGMEQKDEIIITPLPDEVQVPVPETSKGSSWQMFWITSAIALILSFVMYWLPSCSSLLHTTDFQCKRKTNFGEFIIMTPSSQLERDSVEDFPVPREVFGH